MADGTKILIIDDEEHTRLGYSEILRLDGYVVVTAENGIDGLEKLEEEDVDIIITDLRMPEMDGLTFIEQIREKGIDTKVIVITAFGSFQSYKHSKNLGTVYYLNKPVKAGDLKETIEKAISSQ